MFQFQCPQGHLLEGDESQAGDTINCPLCGILFIIPAPIAVPEPEPEYAAPQIHVGAGAAPALPDEPAAPVILHIPCPNGHILDTPEEMLDQEVLCPQCGVQFRLRNKDSVEYKQKKKEADELRQLKMGNAWLNYAIIAAVLVVLLLFGLIALRMANN